MKPIHRIAVAATLGLIGAGCGSDPTAGFGCDVVEHVGLYVHVRDAATGTPLTEGTNVRATAGDYEEDLKADEIEILSHVVLEQGVCHVTTCSRHDTHCAEVSTGKPLGAPSPQPRRRGRVA